MIDWLTCVIPFRHEPLGSDVILRLDSDGEVVKESRLGVTFKGSWESFVFFRTSDVDAKGFGTHLYFSGNPSKFLQGHNILGSDDACKLLSKCLACFFGGDYRLYESAVLNAKVLRVDINYSYELDSQDMVLSALDYLSESGKTRHSSVSRRGSSVYWGLGSRRWFFKAYSKHAEISSSKSRGLPQELSFSGLDLYASTLLRMELQLRSLELKKFNNRPFLISDFTNYSPLQIYNDYFDKITFSHNEVIQMSDDAIHRLPKCCLGTYHLWSTGSYSAVRALSKATFYRHRKLILDAINVDIGKPRTTIPFEPKVKVAFKFPKPVVSIPNQFIKYCVV